MSDETWDMDSRARQHAAENNSLRQELDKALYRERCLKLELASAEMRPIEKEWQARAEKAALVSVEAQKRALKLMEGFDKIHLVLNAIEGNDESSNVLLEALREMTRVYGKGPVCQRPILKSAEQIQLEAD